MTKAADGTSEQMVLLMTIAIVMGSASKTRSMAPCAKGVRDGGDGSGERELVRTWYREG